MQQSVVLCVVRLFIAGFKEVAVKMLMVDFVVVVARRRARIRATTTCEPVRRVTTTTHRSADEIDNLSLTDIQVAVMVDRSVLAAGSLTQ
jgi:hypothetical protein